MLNSLQLILLLTLLQPNNGDGGVFHYVNTGTNTFTMTTTDLNSIYASNSGGIGSLAGATTIITLNTLDIDSCHANANNGVVGL